MTKLKQIYQCKLCGNMVEVIHEGPGKLVCCGQSMVQIVENTVDAAKEKHVPVIEKTNDGVLVKVGSVEHPMQDTHYIEWIELYTENKIYRKYLKPGEKPQAEFKICCSDNITARAYCNLHGLWKAE